MLLHITGGVVTLRQHLDADGAVDCGKHGVRITQTEAIALAFRDDCAEALPEFGYQEVECNDQWRLPVDGTLRYGRTVAGAGARVDPERETYRLTTDLEPL